MNGTNLPREQLLAALNSSAKSITQIAAELGIGVRSAMTFRSLAGVAAVFRNDEGEPFFANADVPLIRQAMEKHGPLNFRGAGSTGEPVTVGENL